MARMNGAAHAAALAVLADETFRWHDSMRSLALFERRRWLILLTKPGVGRRPWTFEKIGALIDVSKRREREIIRKTPGSHCRMSPAIKSETGPRGFETVPQRNKGREHPQCLTPHTRRDSELITFGCSQ